MSSSGGSSSPARRKARFRAGRGRSTSISFFPALGASAAMPTTSATRQHGADFQGLPGLMTGISGPSRYAERETEGATGTRSASAGGASAAAGTGAVAASATGAAFAADALAPAFAPERVLEAATPAFSLPDDAGAVGDTGSPDPAAVACARALPDASWGSAAASTGGRGERCDEASPPLPTPALLVTPHLIAASRRR